jgi:hypothetical protein
MRPGLPASTLPVPPLEPLDDGAMPPELLDAPLPLLLPAPFDDAALLLPPLPLLVPSSPVGENPPELGLLQATAAAQRTLVTMLLTFMPRVSMKNSPE